MSSFHGRSDVEVDLDEALRALRGGRRPADIERRSIEFKEEPGRRAADGSLLGGAPQNEDAAQFLWRELACLSNTPGGGALILGVANDGQRIGTDLDAEWLRHRIYELSGRGLTAEVRPYDLDDGTRLLVCRVPQAIEPHRVNGKIHWRVDDHCVEIDAATWHDRVSYSRHDWSVQPSDRLLQDADGLALAAARSFLKASGEQAAAELAEVPDDELLRRIPNVSTGDGRLTNAGRLLFTSIPSAIDYRRRAAAGGDAVTRVNDEGPLLVQIRRVFDALDAHRRTVHVPGSGAVVGQFETLPARSAREAIVNGIVHRDWNGALPTEIEHVADRLRVTSPGGLVGTVTPENIITHPSTPRHRGLAEATSKLRLTEREGIGVDRMFLDLLTLGRPGPEIVELPGPTVRTTLAGGEPDVAWVRARTSLQPVDLASDLNALLALDLVANRGWIDVRALSTRIQDSAIAAQDTLDRLAHAKIDNAHVLVPVEGQPDARREMAWRLSDTARTRIGQRARRAIAPTARRPLLRDYAYRFGRVSSTEAASLCGLSSPAASEILKEMEADGDLVPSRANRRGRGFHYLPADASRDQT